MFANVITTYIYTVSSLFVKFQNIPHRIKTDCQVTLKNHVWGKWIFLPEINIEINIITCKFDINM